MANTLDGWKSARVIHLFGGCRAINGFNENVELAPHALNGKLAAFTTRSYGALFSDCEKIGLSIVGTDFISHQLEVKGITPPEWRTFHRLHDTVWPCEEEVDTWSEIGHAAFTRNNGRLWDIASRVSHQLRVCSWRLRQISEAYSNQLNARAKSKFQVGQRFQDAFTWLAYLAIQSFLVDACVLRDYLTEYYSLFLCPDQDLVGGSSITSMGKLKKKVLNNTKSEDPITKTLQASTDDGGWLYEVGAYRDLVVHSAPLAQAQGHLFAVADEVKLGSNGALPAIRLPIPAHPQVIAKSRANGEYFEDFSKQFEIFMLAMKGDTPSADGLVYAHTVLGHLATLARQMSQKSPVPPEIPHFDESSIIGPITINRV